MNTAAVDVPADAQPRIGRGFRLQWEEVQNCHVLLYPEGMIRLNQSGGEILKRCDGERSVEAIVADIERAFTAEGLAPDIAAFLTMARDKRWVEWQP